MMVLHTKEEDMPSSLTRRIIEAGLTEAETVEGVNAKYRARGFVGDLARLDSDGHIYLRFTDKRSGILVEEWIEDHRTESQLVEAAPQQHAAEAMATDRQIGFIKKLIARGAHQEGGFVGGITSTMDFTELTRAQASSMIDSMLHTY